MHPHKELFDPDIYRANNLDLAPLGSAAALAVHFAQCGRAEPRIYGRTETTSQYLSMKWLRGKGVEIGAGRFPTPLYGTASAINLDIEAGELFGTQGVSHHYSIDDPVPPALGGRFDFVIASHVLEHADGIIRAVENLLELSRPDGLVYIAVPDMRFLDDAAWMPNFDMAHHKEEYETPGQYHSLHDQLFRDHTKAQLNAAMAMASSGAQSMIYGQVHDKDVLRLLEPGEDGQSRFVYHKHTYDPDGWNGIFVDIQRHLSRKFAIVETRYGMERCDCHFVLRKIGA